ncbi:LuxR C-terminal-related transcriptional regulator [Mycolicibacterium thermoresistibile]
MCVGRDAELAELGRLRAAAETGGAHIATVIGAPGIGKSTLLRRLVAEYPGARWAVAAEWESDVPGAVLSQLLQEPAPSDPGAGAARLLDVLTTARTPQLLVVDDAEHCDAVSLQALATAVRRHRDLPVLIVFAVTARQPLIAELTSTELPLGGLAPTAVRALATLRNLVMHSAAAAALTRHTGGNPRDVLALLDELPAAAWSRSDAVLPAPAHVTREVAAQLDRCTPAGRALVEALAVLGAEAALADVTQLAGLDDPLPAIDDARRTGLLAPLGGWRPQLREPLTGAAILDLMGVHAAAAAHRRAAGIVTDPVRRLRHLVAATPTTDPALADEVDRLARDRGTHGAWAEAADLFQQASRLSADPLLRDDRLTRAVDALVAAGDCTAAAALVPTVENLRETPLREATLAYLAIVRGRAAEAEMRLRRAGDIVNTERDPESAALIAQRHVLHALMRCRNTDLVNWADRAIALSGDDSPAGVEAAAIRGLGLSAAGRGAEAASAYDKLTGTIRRGAQTQRVALGRGWLELSNDDLDGARSHLESAVATVELGGSVRISLWALGWLARVQFLTGEWDQALRSVDHGRALAADSGIVLATPLLEWTAAQIYALRGEWPPARQAARDADTATQDYEMMLLPTYLARAQIAEAQADYAEVRRMLDPLAKMTSRITVEPGLWPWADVLGNALAIEGDLAAADLFLQPHEERARAQRRRSTLARLGYARGRLLGAAGDLPAARKVFDESLALLEGTSLRYDRARVNFAYGQTLRRAGKRRDADAVISTARELYLSLGAHTYVARCERELKAGGLNIARTPRGHTELTPQEEAVTSLVARGLSNREVAAELYVSPKTVQYHLTRIYAKLGVRSRSELAALRA